MPRITAPAARRRCTRKASLLRTVVGQRERAGRSSPSASRRCCPSAAPGCRAAGRARLPALRSASQRVGFVERLRVEFDHRVERRAGLVDRGDAIEVGLRQRVRCRVRRRAMRRLQRGDVGFVEGERRASAAAGRAMAASRSAQAAVARLAGGASRGRRGRARQGAWRFPLGGVGRGAQHRAAAAGRQVARGPRGRSVAAALAEVARQHPDDQQVDRQHRDREPARMAPQGVQVEAAGTAPRRCSPATRPRPWRATGPRLRSGAARRRPPPRRRPGGPSRD